MKAAGVGSLLTPKVFGFSKKQSTDPLIPPHTCVIFDDRVYNKLMEYCFEDCENPELSYLMNGLKLYFMRNPCLWMTMYQELRVWNRDDFAHHLATKHNILLDNYLCSKRNKDIILIDVDSIVFFAHADSDKH